MIKALRLAEIHIATFIYLILFCLGMFLRAYHFDYSDQDAGILYDHFLNINAANNIAQGNGWTSSGFEFFPLNPETMTTGPTVTLPVSLSIFLFENKINIPSITVSILCISLLLVFLYLQKSNAQIASFNWYIVLTLTGFLCYFPHYWNRHIGEMPAILCSFITIALLSKSQLMQSIIAAGLVAGLAITSKMLALIPVIGIASSMLFIGLLNKNKPRLLIKKISIFISFAIIPSALFSLYQIYVLQSLPAEWSHSVSLYKYSIFEQLSGLWNIKVFLSTDISTTEYIKFISFRSFPAITSIFNGSFFPHGGLITFIIFTLASVIYIYKKGRQENLLLFFIPSLYILLWFILISGALYTRYLVIYLFLQLHVFILIIASMTSPKKRNALGIILFAFLILTSGNPKHKIASQGNPEKSSRASPSIYTISLNFPFANSTYMKDTLEMAQIIQDTNLDRLTSLNIFNNNVFEYLSPHQNIMYNFSDYITEAFTFDERRYLELFPEVAEAINNGDYTSGFDHYTKLPFQMGPYSFTLDGKTSNTSFKNMRQKGYQAPLKFHGLSGDVNKTYGFFSMKDSPTDKSSAICGAALFENTYYVLYTCSTTQLNQLLKNNFSQIGFRPLRWMRPRATYPEDFKFF